MTAQPEFLSSAVVLCGGKSTRAGFDKQTIRIDNMWIAEWIADRLANVFDEVLLVTNRPALYAHTPFLIVQDLIRGVGPLGGIHAGLTYARHDWVFVTACDMPNISEDYLRLLARLARETTSDALVVRQENGFPEPMNAFYHKNCLPVMEQSLLNGERKIADFLQKISASDLPERELIPLGGHESLFYNMNTPEEIRIVQDQRALLCPLPKTAGEDAR